MRRYLLVGALAAALVGVAPTAANAVGGATITGVVTSASSGLPLDGVVVMPVSESGEWVYEAEATTNGVGAYTVSDLAPGRYTLTFYDPNQRVAPEWWWQDQADHATATFFSVIADTTYSDRNTAIPDGGSISGTVTSAATNAPLADILVTVHDPNGGYQQPTTTAADGTYLVQGLAPGDRTVTFRTTSGAGNYAPFDATVTALAYGEPVTVDAAMPAGATISGRVTAGAIPGYGADGAIVRPDLDSSVFATTDSDGYYSLSGLPAGDYTVDFTHHGSGFSAVWLGNTSVYESATRFTLAAGGTHANTDAHLPEGAFITGTVTLPGGDPLEAATVNLYRDGQWEAQGQTEGTGSYGIPELPAGNYTLQVDLRSADAAGAAPEWWENSPGMSGAASFSVTQGAGVVRDVQLITGATISGHVNAPSSVTAYDTDGAIVGNGLTDGSGDFLIEGVPTGDVTLQYFPNSYQDFIQEWTGDAPDYGSATFFQVTAGSPTTGKDATLAAASSISGTITDDDSNPLFNASAIVYAADDPSYPVATALSDADGNFTAAGLPIGNYRVGFTTDTTGTSLATDTFGSLAPSPFALSEYWNNTYGFGAAQTVAVTTAGATVPGINGTLAFPIFADVQDPNSAFYPYIQWMSQSGISTGTPVAYHKPLYKPVNAVSRQAMASFLYKYSTDTFTAPVISTFADVDASNPFYTAIEWMAAEGISTGTPQPSGKPLFKPADPVTRQSMAVFLARYAGIDTTTPPATQSFADVPVTATTAAAIAWMKTSGISTGTAQPSGLPLYKPIDPVSRQAMAAFLFRLDQLP